MIRKISRSISAKFTLFSVCFIFIILSCLFAYNYYTEKNRTREQFITRCKFLLESYGPLVSRAVSFSDDLALISYMQNIMEQSDVLYTMVLDSRGKVLAHHKAAETGKTYDDAVTQKAVKSSSLEIYTYYPAESKYEVYDVSLALRVSGKKIGVLRTGFSTRELVVGMDRYFEKNLVVGVVILLFCSLGSYFFSHGLMSPIAKLKNIIEDMGQLNFTESTGHRRQDELGELMHTAGQTVELIKGHYIEMENRANQWKNRFELYLKNLGMCFRKGVILTDNENRIIYCDGLTGELMFSDGRNLLGKHILEVTRNIELVDALKFSTENSNQVIQKEIKSASRTVSIITVKDAASQLIGTIICGE
jgi:hypothetical protein